MAIRAIIESGMDIKPDRIKELAIGCNDENGKPFEIIKLMALGQSGKGAGSRFHIAGYQDTWITIPADGTDPRIKYGQPGQGTIQFEKNELGRLIGEVARTPWNIATLAAQIAANDKHWKMMDAEQEREVMEAAKKIRISEHTIRDQQKEEKKAAINAEAEIQRQIELSKKNDALKAVEEKADLKDDAPESFPGKNKLLQDLAELTYGPLKQRAVACGVNKEVRERAELINAIVAYEAKKSKGEMAVE